jgi:hypothetical protein
MQGATSEGQNTFGDLIDLRLQIAVELLKFQVELEKRFASDVPMKTADVLVKNLQVGKQIIQALGELLSGLRI